MKDLFGGDLPEGRKPSPPPPPSAKQLRDEGMERVARNSGSWYDKAIQVLATLPYGWTGIGEDMRHFVESKIGRPHHRNVTGPLVKAAIKARIMTKTGEFRHMQDAQSHARESRVYRRG